MQTTRIEMLDDETLSQRAAQDHENRWLRRKLRKASTTGGFFSLWRTSPASRKTAIVPSNGKQNFALFTGTHINGLVSIERAPNAPRVLFVSDMGVEHNQVWEPVHAQALLEAAFQYAAEQQMTLSPINLSAKGKSVIQSALTELEKKYSANSASFRN